VTVSNVSTSSVTANWASVSGARSYYAWVYDPQAGNTIEGQAENTTSTTFSGLSLTSGQTYDMEILAFDSSDLTPSEILSGGTFNRSVVFKAFTVGSGGGTGCTDPNQAVNIPDANLKAAIEQQLGISSDPTCEQMQSLTQLTAEYSNIQSLEGLQYATSLTDLDLGGNQISDIQPLVNNSGLGNGDTLDITCNKLDSGDMDNINALINRGVNVTYKPMTCPSYGNSSVSPVKIQMRPPMPATFIPNAPKELRTRLWKQMWQHHPPRQP
jgi:hypothetical protein